MCSSSRPIYQSWHPGHRPRVLLATPDGGIPPPDDPSMTRLFYRGGGATVWRKYSPGWALCPWHRKGASSLCRIGGMIIGLEVGLDIGYDMPKGLCLILQVLGMQKLQPLQHPLQISTKPWMAAFLMFGTFSTGALSPWMILCASSPFIR